MDIIRQIIRESYMWCRRLLYYTIYYCYEKNKRSRNLIEEIFQLRLTSYFMQQMVYHLLVTEFNSIKKLNKHKLHNKRVMKWVFGSIKIYNLVIHQCIFHFLNILTLLLQVLFVLILEAGLLTVVLQSVNARNLQHKMPATEVILVNGW